MNLDKLPLRPHVRLRVGVTGHRPGPKLHDEVLAPIDASLDRIFRALSVALEPAVQETRWAFGQARAELAVVSPLAEGADRMVAQAGLRAGAALEVVLPARQAAYEADFEAEGSTAAFRGLLSRAMTVFQLEHPQGRSPLGAKRGYEAAGLVMLGHSDIVIAIWDEAEAAGIGGTGAIVAQAVSEGAPVLLINPAAPDVVRLLWTGDLDLPPGHVRVEDLPPRDALPLLPTVVEALVAPPPGAAARDGLRAYYQEQSRRRPGLPVYSTFLWTVGVRPLHLNNFIDMPVESHETDTWRARFPGRETTDPLTDAVCETLLPTVAASDHLAVRYGEFYRSAFVFNFIAAAVAVSLALLGLTTELFDGWPETSRLAVKAVLVALEIGLIIAILVVWRRGRLRYWHQRWLNYRRAAEWLRHLRILSLVGAPSPGARPRLAIKGRSEVARGSRLEQDDWVAWYVRSIERLLPLPNRTTDAAYMTEVRATVVEAELNGQIAYHHANSHRMEAVGRRLHLNGIVLFGAPVVVGAVFLLAFVVQLVTGRHWAEAIRFFVTGLTAGFPTFGAALNAVRVQGDFETVGERSAGTAARLAVVRNALETEPLEFPRLADRTQHAAEVMSSDLAEWQTLSRTRPLGLPA